MRSLLVLATPFIPAACGTDTSPAPAGPEVVVETIGDTTVVRTLSGSVWGAEATLVPEISVGEVDGPEEYLFGSISSIAVDDDHNVYVLDGQAQHVRVFDSAGGYVETLGGRGEGPGEFGYAEAIALLSDSRLLVRDSRSQRISVFGPGRGQTDQWGFDAGNSGSNHPLHTDVQGRTYLITRDLSSTDWVMHIIVLGPDGTHLDTLPEPSSPYEPPLVVAEGEVEGGYATYRNAVPFAPSFQWTVHPSGHMVTGLPADYRIDLARDDGILRIERNTDPAAVHADEGARQRDNLERRLQANIPGWSWNGPPIPDHKPFFRQLLAGRDGRIWVRLWTEAHRVENTDHDPEDPRSDPVTWEEPLRYDVFEPDGTYLGVVVPPGGFTPYVNPVFDGDHVWGVTRDALGVERVVRFRIVVGG
ncbi:MAG: 6-bladed beta-propeller [Gemmatimonadetes bacterium]|nr:6-bladed beta-propeller [Gemmatimonadota bacterium]